MCESFIVIARTAVLLCVLVLAACAATPQNKVDPIFQAVPGGRYACDNASDTRNPFVQGMTSTAGQALIGGAVGGFVGHQFGSDTGRDIATGTGAAAGIAAGAWNARRMKQSRYARCQQRQSLGY